MTEPATPTPAPTPAPAKVSWLAKVKAAVAWAGSPSGRKDIGAAVAAVTAIYTVIHRAGL